MSKTQSDNIHYTQCLAKAAQRKAAQRKAAQFQKG